MAAASSSASGAKWRSTSRGARPRRASAGCQRGAWSLSTITARRLRRNRVRARCATRCGIRCACTRRSRASRPRRICASASFEARRRFGADQGGGGGGPSRRRFHRFPPHGRARARMSSTRSPANSRSIALRRAVTGPSPAGSAKAPSIASTGIAAAQRLEQLGEAGRGDPVGGDPGRDAIGGVEPLAGQRAIGAELARQARQEPGRPDVGKEADADLRHREHEAVAGDAMRAVHRNADAAAHDDAVDQRHVGLAITLDPGVERVFLAPRTPAPRRSVRRGRDRRGARMSPPAEKARPPLAVTITRVTAGSLSHSASCARERAHHAVRHGIERLRAVERDEAGGAAALEQDVGSAFIGGTHTTRRADERASRARSRHGYVIAQGRPASPPTRARCARRAACPRSRSGRGSRALAASAASPRAAC